MKFLRTYLPGLLLLIVSAIAGIVTLHDYGISWDEPQQRLIGTINYNYVFNGDKRSLLEFNDKEYGPAFELPLIIVEKGLHLTDPASIYHARHLIIHLVFLLGAFAAYVLARRLSGSDLIAIAAFCMLVLSPRIYAHSFFNSKDIPLLAFFAITLAVGHYVFTRNKTIGFIFLGILCGYTTAIRITGLVLLGAFALLLLLDWLQDRDRKRFLSHSIALACGFLPTLFICWPFLWSSPIGHFAAAYSRMTHFKDFGSVFFKGANIEATKLPFSYFFTWFGITIPLIWLLTGTAGFIWLAVDLVRQPRSFLRQLNNKYYLAIALCFALPVAAVLIFKSVIYDDWRHLYFVYPAFILVATWPLLKISKSKGRLAVTAVTIAFAIQLITISDYFVRNHPFGQLYFSPIVSHDNEYLRHNYELDYWGSSFYQGLQNLTHAHPSGTLKLYTAFNIDLPLKNNIMLLSPADQKRITVQYDTLQADYLITNFRGHPNDYPFPAIDQEIRVGNSTVLRTYKLH